jgi:hypothetical protein
MKRERAEALAAGALAWIAGDEEMLAGFLGSSGADAGDIRARAGEPEFLGFVLDFLMSDDQAVVAFAASAGVRPEAVAEARAALPGGDLPSWT